MSVASKYKHVSRGEYNGKPMFVMCQTDDEEQANKFNTFQFGIEKAKACVEHYEALVAFVESDGESIGKRKSKTVSSNGSGKKTKKATKVAVED